MYQQTVSDYLARVGEQMDDFNLSTSSDGDKIGRTRAIGLINSARRAILLELLAHGIAETLVHEVVELTVDSSNSDVYALPPRYMRLVSLATRRTATDDDDPQHVMFSSMRTADKGFVVEGRSIRWFNREPPTVTQYAYVVNEPVAMHFGTAQDGGASTITLAGTATIGRVYENEDYYNGAEITIESGIGAGQIRVITDYVGSTKVATVGVAWDTEPDSTSVYSIMDSLPIAAIHAVILRACLNLLRVDETFAPEAKAMFNGEYQKEYNSLLMLLKVPASSVVDGPRRGWTPRH